VGIVRFEVKTESNQIELFDKFKITKTNQTVCISNWPNCYYWHHWKKKTKQNRILEGYSEPNYSASNW